MLQPKRVRLSGFLAPPVLPDSKEGDLIEEAKKNSVYLMALGGFHIRLQQGSNYNFVVLNAAGQFQPPDPLLAAIAREMGKN